MFCSRSRSKPSRASVSRQTCDGALLRVRRLERREPAHVGDVVRRRHRPRAPGRAAGRTSARGAASHAAVAARCGRIERALELAQRDPLLLLVARDRVGLAGDLGLELLARAEQVEPLGVELGRALGLERRRAPRGRRTPSSTASRACAERSGSSSPLQRHARGEDRVLERVLALGELGRDEPALAGLAQPVQPLALVVRPRPSSASRSASSCVAAEEVGVARDDRRLLGDLLLADADRAALLRALEEVALERAFELGGGAERRLDGDRVSLPGARRPPIPRSWRRARLERRTASETIASAPAARTPDVSAVPVSSATRTSGSSSCSSARKTTPVARPDVHVEQHDLRAARPWRSRRASVERGRLERRGALELEVDPAQEADRGVVVDDQDREGGHGGRV